MALNYAPWVTTQNSLFGNQAKKFRGEKYPFERAGVDFTATAINQV